CRHRWGRAHPRPIPGAPGDPRRPMPGSTRSVSSGPRPRSSSSTSASSGLTGRMVSAYLPTVKYDMGMVQATRRTARPTTGAVHDADERTTRERILDIALDLFIDKGYDKASL